VENRVQAYQLMQGAFEQARNDRDTTWIDGTPNAWDLKLQTGIKTETPTVGGKTFTILTTVSDYLDPTEKSKRKIDVEVKDKTGKQILSGSTILTNWIKP
jgi:hypothetical protein